jgi:hypothetical protein
MTAFVRVSLITRQIQSGLCPAGVDDLEGLPIDIQADEDADLVDGGKGFRAFVKTAGAEASHQDIEKFHIPEGSLEPVNQRGTWFISKKCSVTKIQLTYKINLYILRHSKTVPYP